MNRAQRALTVAHQDQLARLRTHTANTVLTAWDHVGPTYDDAAIAKFLPLALPTVAAAQHLAATQTRGYLDQYLGQPIPPADPAVLTPAALRNGTPPAEVYQRPFRQVWWRLFQGDDPDQAIAQGRSRLASTAQMDVQLAVRGAGIALASNVPTIQGWERNADGGACDLCAAADGEQIGPNDEWGLHPFCGCTASPLDTEPDPDANGADPDLIAVHDHGELGALLYQAGQTFSDL